MFLVRFINYNGKYETHKVYDKVNAEYFLDWLENVGLTLIYIARVS